MLKMCSKCGEARFTGDFSPDKNRTDGRMPICKICRAKSARDKYQRKTPVKERGPETKKKDLDITCPSIPDCLEDLDDAL